MVRKFLVMSIKFNVLYVIGTVKVKQVSAHAAKAYGKWRYCSTHS
jgi:hypothetical protein